MDDIRSISNETVTLAMRRALFHRIGPAQTRSYDQAADEIGVEARTMKSWCHGETPPQLFKALRLMGMLGPGFANDIVGLVGLRTEPITAGDGCPLQANAKIANALFILAAALSDGRMDHLEEPEVVKAMKDLMAWLPGFIAAHDKTIQPLRQPAG